MGQALARGWLDAGIDPASVTIVDPSEAARALARQLGVSAAGNTEELKTPVDIVVLAVKPAMIEAVLQSLPPAAVHLSIAAGRSIAEISRCVAADAAIVRAMPNTPAAIGLGVTGLCANSTASAADRELVSDLMSAVGQVEWLADESQMDALTAVSGSGPAYVFLLIECLTEAGIEAGLEADLAERLATATVNGASAYAAVSESDAATLRRQVTSPNGTTAAALDVLLEKDALKKLFGSAVAAATMRSRELRSG